MILDNLNNAKKSIDTTNIMTNTTLTHERSTIVVLMFILKIKKASEMQQPSCKSNSFGQTGFLFSRFINVMCQESIFWHCWFTRRRFLNIKIINHFRPPLGPPNIPNITLEEDHARNIWAKFG